jgi:glycosyltransferase involved in cell wall biosynthesis
MVVPLFSGSGMRVKIIEGMALGKAIITTPIGAEGIAAKNGEEIMLASTAEEFKKAIRNCLQNPTLVDEMGKKARLFAEVHFANREIGKKVLDFYAGLKRLNH